MLVSERAKDRSVSRGVRSGFLVLLAAVVLVTSCRSTSSDNQATNGGATQANVDPNAKYNALEPDATPNIGGKLIVRVPNETNGWNPFIDQWTESGALVGASVIEPLVNLSPAGDWEPFLVDKLDHNSDYRKWDITLHPGITFSNGAPLDSAALKKNIEAAYSEGLYQFALASQYDHIEITGPLSVRAYLKVSWAQYPATLNTHWMLAPEMLDTPDHGVLHPIGTGPFVFQEWKQGEYFRVTRNPSYWRKDKAGRQLPYLSTIEFRPIADDAQTESQLVNGDIDLALTISAHTAQNLDATFTELRQWTNDRSFIMLNVAEGESNAPNPFVNLHARRALAYATDRVAIAKQVGDGVQVTTQAYRPDTPWGLPVDQDGYYPFDQDKARQEVAAYKADTGRDLTFTLAGIEHVENTELLQTLAGQWKQVGIDAKISMMEQPKYIILTALGTYQAVYFRWFGWSSVDNNYVYNASETSNPVGQLSINFTHYSSPAMDANLRAEKASEDMKTRVDAIHAIGKEINEQAINIWLFDTPFSFIANKRVHGLNALRKHIFSSVGPPMPFLAEVWV